MVICQKNKMKWLFESHQIIESENLFSPIKKHKISPIQSKEEKKNY